MTKEEAISSIVKGIDKLFEMDLHPDKYKHKDLYEDLLKLNFINTFGLDCKPEDIGLSRNEKTGEVEIIVPYSYITVVVGDKKCKKRD